MSSFFPELSIDLTRILEDLGQSGCIFKVSVSKCIAMKKNFLEISKVKQILQYPKMHV